MMTSNIFNTKLLLAHAKSILWSSHKTSTSYLIIKKFNSMNCAYILTDSVENRVVDVSIKAKIVIKMG